MQVIFPSSASGIGVLTCSIDGSGGVISAGASGIIAAVPRNGTIVSFYIVGREASGSIQVDLQRWNGAAYVSMVGAGNKPAIVTAQRANALANGAWTSKALVQYDELQFYIDSCTTFTYADLVIFYTIP